jgi:hypothetical protein
VDQTRVSDLKSLMSTEKHKRGAEIIRRWRLQSLVPAFEHWKDFVHGRQQHKRDLLRRMLMRWMKGSMWAALRQWHTFVEHQRVDEYKRRIYEQQNKRRIEVRS